MLHYPIGDFPRDASGKSFHDYIAELRALLKSAESVEVVDVRGQADLHIVLLNSADKKFVGDAIGLVQLGAKIWYFIPRSTIPEEFLKILSCGAPDLRSVDGVFPYDDILDIWRKVLVLTGSKQFIPAMPGTMIEARLHG